MRKLDYFTLLSSEPIYVVKIGHIKPPKLIDVCHLGLDIYNTFLTTLLLNKDKFMELTHIKQSDDDYFDLIFTQKDYVFLLSKIFTFFMCEVVQPDMANKRFDVIIPAKDSKTGTIIGIINKDNFDLVRDIILQFNYCLNTDTDDSKVSDEHTAKLMKKIAKYRKKFSSQKTNNNDDYALPNIISKLCAYSSNVNMTDIWNYTVFQVYDQFFTLHEKITFTTSYFNYAIWGGDHDKLPKWYNNTFEKRKKRG